MRFNIVIRYVGLVLVLNALFMFAAAATGMIGGGDSGVSSMLLSGIVTLALGSFPLLFVSAERNLATKEGYVIVVGAWVLSCIVGMFPYLMWGGEFGFVNALFESVSGFTTTGATILRDVEAVPHSLLFWRSSTNWLGGIGVVMFVMVVLPSMGRARTTLSNLQLSSMARDNFRYKTNKVVAILLSVYLGMTFLETVLLRTAGMDWFDALNHSMSTVATGGFSTRTASIAHYDSFAIEAIVMLFMLISGMHFGLIFATITGRRNNIFRSEVTRYYVLSVLAAGLIISASLWLGGIYPTLLSSLRYGMFQIVSVTTTAGFATADSAVWTPAAIVLLILFSFSCACAGSTSGGIKTDRMWLAYKSIWVKIRQLQHPSAIVRIKMDGVTQSDETLGFVNLFIVMYIVFVAIGTVIFTVLGVDLMTAFSVAFSSMSNVGPGFGMIGSLDNYSQLPVSVKVISPVLMLIGRLEIFGFIQILFFRSWR